MSLQQHESWLFLRPASYGNRNGVVRDPEPDSLFVPEDSLPLNRTKSTPSLSTGRTSPHSNRGLRPTLGQSSSPLPVLRKFSSTTITPVMSEEEKIRAARLRMFEPDQIIDVDSAPSSPFKHSMGPSRPPGSAEGKQGPKYPTFMKAGRVHIDLTVD
jgi:hypothetical protein